jgi:hypothetical protein
MQYESMTNTPSSVGNTSQALSQASVNQQVNTPSSVASNSIQYNPIAPPDDPPNVNLFGDPLLITNEQQASSSSMPPAEPLSQNEIVAAEPEIKQEEVADEQFSIKVEKDPDFQPMLTLGIASTSKPKTKQVGRPRQREYTIAEELKADAKNKALKDKRNKAKLEQLLDDNDERTLEEKLKDIKKET